MGVRTTYKWNLYIPSLRVKMKCTSKVTEYQPNKGWSKDIFMSSSVIGDHLSFNPIEGGTRFTLRYDIKFGGFFKLFSSRMAKSTHENMKNAADPEAVS